MALASSPAVPAPPEAAAPAEPVTPPAVRRWVDSALEDLARGRLEAAASKLRLARWSFPQDLESGLLLAWIEAAQGRWAEAARTVQALPLDGRPAAWRLSAWGLAGMAYRRTGDPAAAARALRQALDADPRAGLVHEEMGRLALAAELDPKTAERLAPAWPGSRPGSPADWRAAAEGQLREAVRLAPERVDAYLVLAQSLMDAGRWADAAELLKQANRVDHLLPEIHDLLGQAYEHLDQLPAAIAEYRRALELDPQYLPARRHLERLQPEAPAASRP
ncbi:MAG: tetratricopeptide repeat protein [Limnochordaceae bacterium]|nr:tetratricopeptide repeat protein [Limnochordaceae bacterium]